MRKLLAIFLSIVLSFFSLVSAPLPVAAEAPNLISNSSAELLSGSAPTSWTPDFWGTATTNLTVSGDAHTGSKSLNVTTTSYVDGDAKWKHAPASITGGQSYIFSDYSKANVATKLVAAYANSTGSTSYAYLAGVNASSSWQLNSIEFTAPETAQKVTVFHILEGVGSLTVDDFSLVSKQQPTPPQPSNLMPNGSLETVNPSNAQQPLSWAPGKWGSNSVAFTYPQEGHSGVRSVKTQINSYSSGAAYWYTAPLPVEAGKLYSFADYYKSNVVSEIDASFIMQDGSEQYLYVGQPSKSSSEWTKFEAQITVPSGAVSVMFFHSIFSVGYLMTDDYDLHQFNYSGFNRALVSITNDDGFAGFYTNGLPVLQRYNLPATAYIVSGYVGSDEYVSVNQLLSLQAAGIEIGSHSVDHADLTTLSTTNQKAELKDSQTSLQNWLGQPITNYAAPYGAYNQQVVSAASLYYSTYRGVQPGYNAKNNFDAMNLRVQNIVSTTTVADLQQWLQEAAATKTWLILVYHEISSNPDDPTYNTLPSDFDAQMSAVKNSGIQAVTVKQAMNEISPQLNQ